MATKCPQCLEAPVLENFMTVDHVIPISLGGPHTPSNLRPLCFACNVAKGASVDGLSDSELRRAASDMPLELQRALLRDLGVCNPG